MPIGIPAALIISAVAGAGTSIYAARTQSRGAQEGLDAQTAATNAALEYQKEQDRLDRERQAREDEYRREQDKLALEERLYERDRLDRRSRLEVNRYGDYTNNIAPYLATGASANEAMARLLGLPAPPPYVPRPTQGPGGGVPFVDPGTAPSVPGETAPRLLTDPNGPPVSTANPVPAGKTVLMRAPNGQTKEVPEWTVPHYESLGATRVA